MRAYEGKSRFKLHFFNWLGGPEYTIPMSDVEKEKFLGSLSEEMDEVKLAKSGLTPEQLLFRREKLDELDMDFRLFKQEYPLTLDECFQSTGFSFFSVIPYDIQDKWERIDRNLHVLESAWKHPQSSRYAIGADVSAGVRRDRSVIQVVDIYKWELVS